MKRNTLLIAVVAVVAVLFVFNPFQLLRGRGTRRPAVSPQTLSPLASWARSGFRPPEDYILSCFRSHDIVFLGEFYKISQNVKLVSALIPRLYAAGVRNLGIEYALAEDQPRIDALLTAPSYSEAEARRITFRWIVTWGFQEYIDLYRAAWEVNHGRPAGSPPFRIVALNVRQNWEYVKAERDMTDPETVRKILANGVPDAFMAQVILREIAARGEKALIFCNMQHAFTRYREREYERNAAARGFPETRRTGNIVREAVGDRAFTILLHAPWPDRRSPNGLSYPAEGVLDALMDALPPDLQSAGFDTGGSPFGELPLRTGSLAEGYQGLTLSGVCDGYVLQGPIAKYTTVTPIEGFVPEGEGDYAVKNFPGPKPPGLTVAQVNQSIPDDVKSVDAALRQMQ